MSSLLKMSMVSYINSKPFQQGMELTGLINQIELHLEIPALTAEKLKNNEVDIALVPVAALPSLPTVKIITDYCIGATDHVDSVYLFSQVPINQVERVYLDSHSRTSANLVQILLREYWKKEVDFITNVEVSPVLVADNSACLMIGDKAFTCQNKFAYSYDLATAWHIMTGLPFVFAVWVSNEKGSVIEKDLNRAFKIGLQDIKPIVQFYQSRYSSQNMEQYLTKSISYQLNDEKRKALNLFLEKCKENLLELSK